MPRLRVILTVLSFFLSILLLALGSRSYKFDDCVTYNQLWGDDLNSHRRYLGAFSDKDGLCFFVNVEHRTNAGFSLLTDTCAGPPGFDYFSRPRGLNPYYRAPTHWLSYEHHPNWLDVHLLLPHWLIALFLGLPILFMLFPRFRHRARSGRCPHCNYDLRATPNLCPECGHIPLPAKPPPLPPLVAPSTKSITF